jgi:polysaccharide biosynthesis/export protein
VNDFSKRKQMASNYCWIFAGSFIALLGCSSVSADKPQGNKASSDELANVSNVAATADDDSERLAQLWQRRKQQSSAPDYPIGPGDVVEISVPGMEEIKDLFVRVSGEGMISVPFAGVINVTGMTDKTLKEEIRRRLEENYMKNPQVSVFVKEFRSRQVAVIGAVQKPGLYNLASSADTVLSMLGQAGGMNNLAAERILFIPAEPAEPEKAKEIASALPAQLISQDPSPLIIKSSDPIVINLDSIRRSGNEKYLNIPARPGDVIMVPGAGEVLVQGWIQKPGSYKITPGLTILGAVAAAGGPMYAADTNSVKIIRTGRQGQKVTLSADLESLKRGEQPDIPVQEGDVIELGGNGPRMALYGVYTFFTNMMHVGASVGVR